MKKRKMSVHAGHELANALYIVDYSTISTQPYRPMTQPQPQVNPRILQNDHQKCLPVRRFDMNFEYWAVKFI